MRESVILATGSYLPEQRVFNKDMTQFPRHAWKLVEEKLGVVSRRFAAGDQCTSDLAARAGRTCLEKAGFPVDRVQGIIVSTSSPDRIQPPTATRVQQLLGADRAFAFDMNSVCSGSTFGICLADSLIKSGNYDNILFIAAETYSKILNRKDFSSFPFFGDGAGAILFGNAAAKGRGVLHSCLRSNGGGSEVICVPAGGTMLPFADMTDLRKAYFRMSGKAVYEFATSQGTAIIRRLLDEAGVPLDAIRRFVCHQANLGVIRDISGRLGIPLGKFVIHVDRYGNTASASVLIGLDEAISGKFVAEGDLVVTAAYGGGLSWGANLIRI